MTSDNCPSEGYKSFVFLQSWVQWMIFWLNGVKIVSSRTETCTYISKLLLHIIDFYMTEYHKW